MKLLVLSDLHVEFKPYEPDAHAVAACDAVVLAGDIHKGARAVTWAREKFANKPIVLVLGNHEFYGGHWDETLTEMREAAKEHAVHVLENEEVQIDGVRFLGCTLWTDFDYFGPDARDLAKLRYEEGLNDCHKIRASERERPPTEAPEWKRLTAEHVRQRHVRSKEWLRSSLAADPEIPTVIVTHHLPRRESVPERYKYNELTPGFASRLSRTLMAGAQLWIHGHVHDSVDYLVDGLGPRVVSNPRGYPRGSGGNENPAFDDRMLVEVA